MPLGKPCSVLAWRMNLVMSTIPTYQRPNPPVRLAVAEEEVCVSHALVGVDAEVDGRVPVEELEERHFGRDEPDVSRKEAPEWFQFNKSEGSVSPRENKMEKN